MTFFLSIYFQYFGGVSCCLVSLFFILSNDSIIADFNYLLLGRTFIGIIYGIISVTLLLHIADNSSQFFRRFLLWVYGFVLSIPLFLVAYLFGCFMETANFQMAAGFIMMAGSIIAMILMPVTYESIVYLIGTGNKDLKALGILIKLRNNARQFIKHDFNELRVMIVEDSQRGANIFRHGNCLPLSLVLLLRLLNAVLANNLINFVFVSNLWYDFGSRIQNETKSVADELEMFITNMSTTTEDYVFTDFNSTIETTTILPNIGLLDINLQNATETTESTTFLDLMEKVTSDYNATEVFSVRDSVNAVFIHSFYTYQKPALAPELILLLIFVAKLLFGIPFLYVAEKAGIFRNRIFFKTCLIIGIVNFISSIFVRISYVCDDSSLMFTYYLVKLFNVIKLSFILVSFGVDTIGYEELAESFSLTKRNGSIAAVLITEHLGSLFCLFILFDFYYFYYHYLHAIMIIIISYSLLRFMPVNPLDLSLRNARDKYWSPE